MEKEYLIVSLTTWSKRIGNIPTVLDTIYSQTMLPDKVVLNLAYGEPIPPNVQDYIKLHNIEVFRTEDTKVYKKIIPTLKRYKSACVINIDDDLLYPDTMIEDFWNTHLLYPDNPICGNHLFYLGRMCHCGEASLTKFDYFNNYLDCIDNDVMLNCTSSDMVFTYFASKAGHPYVPSKGHYGSEYLEAFNQIDGWSKNINTNDKLKNTLSYLEQRFGELPEIFSTYIKDRLLSDVIVKISEGLIAEAEEKKYYETERAIRNSNRYRLGRFLLAPFSRKRPK